MDPSRPPSLYPLHIFCIGPAPRTTQLGRSFRQRKPPRTRTHGKCCLPSPPPPVGSFCASDIQAVEQTGRCTAAAAGRFSFHAQANHAPSPHGRTDPVKLLADLSSFHNTVRDQASSGCSSTQPHLSSGWFVRACVGQEVLCAREHTPTPPTSGRREVLCKWYEL